MMFHPARRFERGYSLLLIFVGLVALEAMVRLTSMMPLRLSLAVVGAPVVIFFFLFCLLHPEGALIALLFVSISSAAFPIFTQDFAGIYLSEVLLPVILAAYLLRMTVWRKDVPKDKSTTLPLVLLVASSVVSMAWGNLFWDPSVPTNHRYLVVQAVGVVLIILPVATFLLFANCFDVRRNLRWLLPALIVLPSLGSLATLAAFASELRSSSLAMSTIWRGVTGAAPLWASPLTSWTSLGFLAAPLAFSVSVYTTRPRTRLLSLALLAPMVLVTLVSLKIGSLICLSSACAVIAWGRSKKLFVALLLTFAVLAAGETLITEGSSIAYVYANSQAKGSFDRFEIWKDGLDIWSTSPLVGVGPGNYYSYSYTYTSFSTAIASWTQLAGKEQNPYGNAHNGYLQILAELGIVGLGLVVWFLVAAVRRGAKALSVARRGQERAFVAGAMGAVIGVMVQVPVADGLYHSVTNTGYQTFVAGMYLWALLGMLVSMSRTGESGAGVAL